MILFLASCHEDEMSLTVTVTVALPLTGARCVCRAACCIVSHLSARITLGVRGAVPTVHAIRHAALQCLHQAARSTRQLLFPESGLW